MLRSRCSNGNRPRYVFPTQCVAACVSLSVTLLTLHRRTLPLPTHAHEQKTTWCRVVDVVRTCVENVNVKRRRLAGRNTNFHRGGANTLLAATNNGVTGPGMMAPGMMGAGMMAPGMMAPPGMTGVVGPVMPIMTMNAFGGMGRGIGPQAGADVDFTNYGGMHSGMMNPHGMHSGVGPRPRLSSATPTPPPMPEFDDCTRGLVAPQLVLAPSTEGAEKPATSVSVTMQLGQHCDRIAVTSKWLWMMGFDRIHDVEASKSSDGAAAAASFVPVCPELATRTWEPPPGILTSTKPPYSIVAANESWLTRCNLTLEDCAGNTCAILQGEETEKEGHAVLLKEGMHHLGIDGRPNVISASLTNYTMHEPRRKFHNEFSIWEIEHSDSGRRIATSSPSATCSSQKRFNRISSHPRSRLRAARRPPPRPRSHLLLAPRRSLLPQRILLLLLPLLLLLRLPLRNKSCATRRGRTSRGTLVRKTTPLRRQRSLLRRK